MCPVKVTFLYAGNLSDPTVIESCKGFLNLKVDMECTVSAL